MDLAERLLYLRSMPAGSDLPAEHLWAMASRMTERSYRAGALIFAQSDPVNRLVFMRHGTVILEQDGVALSRIEAPGTIGVRALIAHIEMPYSVHVQGEVVSLEIDADIYTELIEDHFDVWLILTRFTFGVLLARQQRDPELIHWSPPASTAAVPRSSSLVERILYLRRRGLFGQSSVNALAEVAQRMDELLLEPGQTLYSLGDPSEELYIMLDGQLRFSLPDGFSCALHSGVFLGASETLAQHTRWGTVVAVLPSRLLRLPVESFLDVLEDNTEMAMNFLRRVSRLMLEIDLAQTHQERLEHPDSPLHSIGVQQPDRQRDDSSRRPPPRG